MRRIASGGMAEVFLALVQSPGGRARRVAIKRVHPQLAGDREFMEMLRDEARISSQLDHPRICRTYEYGEIDNVPFLVMEHITGHTLAEIYELTRGARIPPALAALIVARVCEGLDYAHAKTNADGRPLGIVHRDVSPSNIVVTADGDVKLIDFGIAQASSRSTRTRTGVIKGKLAYVSPEQVHGRPVDGRTDIFAAGIVLHELLTGRMLFPKRDRIWERRGRPLVAPSPPELGVPPALERIACKALAWDARERYSRASEMQFALEQVLAEAGPPPGREALAAWIRQHTGVSACMAARADQTTRCSKHERPITARAPHSPSLLRLARIALAAGLTALLMFLILIKG